MNNISIIISTWNNCQVLDTTLANFMKCKILGGLKWELVLVNNNSSDKTKEIVDSYKDRLPINYVEEPVQGLSRARNTGLKAADGELIIFTDDDVYPGIDWLVNYWNAYKSKPKGYYFGGPIESRFEDRSQMDDELLEIAPASVKGLDWGEKVKVLTDGEYFVSANWACSKKYLDLVGGFDETLGLGADSKRMVISEETDLMNRLEENKLKPLYLPNTLIGHYVPKDKSRKKHIMERKRSRGYVTAKTRYVFNNEPYLFNMPRWVFRRFVEEYIKLILQRICGKKAYQQSAEVHYWLGYIDGVRENNAINGKNRLDS